MSKIDDRDPYSIAFTPGAARELRKLRADDAARLRRPILALAFDRRPPGVSAVAGSAYLRIRVGDTRVIFMIDDEARRVVITRVAKRSETTYRRL